MEKVRKELVIFSVLAIVFGILFGWSYVHQPSGDVPINYSQSKSQKKAENFLEELEYENLSGYKVNSTFKTRSEASTFLQLKLSQEKAMDKIKEYSIRYWEVRFYKPKEKEEFIIGVNPITGDVIKFKHTLAEEAPGENLSRDNAFSMVKTFLTDHGSELSGFKLFENSVIKRSNRTDYKFSWREKNVVENAPFEIETKVQGGRIGSFNPHLNIPDEFTHIYKSQRSPGIAFGLIFMGMGAVFVIAAIYFALQYYKRDEFDKKYAGVLAIIAGGLMLLDMVNSLPGILYNVPTTMSPSLFLISMIIGGIIAGLIVGGITLATAVAGKGISKEVLDFDVIDEVLESAPGRERLKYSTFRGFCLAFMLLGVATLFYLVGSKFFGVWMPENSPYISAVSSYVPALMALTAGGIAAVAEETIFRLFSIPFLKRYLKYTALAVVISSFVWGLGHTTYVVLPWYTRIIEVTILGIILGWAFLRYDFVTVLSAHFSMNAVVVGVPMLLAGTQWLQINGIVALLIASIPLLASVALTLYDKTRTS